MDAARSRGKRSVRFALIQWVFHLPILTLFFTIAAQAQSFNVVHSFGSLRPYSGVSIDGAGDLYGTITEEGFLPPGDAYKLTHKNGAWVFSYLLPTNNIFLLQPLSRPVFGPNGSLYGTTAQGGGGCDGGCGNVYNLVPPSTVCNTVTCYWTANTVYDFAEDYPHGGAEPGYGDLVFDSAGNIYGTTVSNISPPDDYGTVFEISPNGSQTILLDFYQTNVGRWPDSGVTFDGAGNLYGTTTSGGGGNCGTVYELSPSGSGWTPTLLHAFNGSDGCGPMGGMIFGHAGNLYGTTTSQGANGGGTVFEMTPSAGGWTFTTIYNFQVSGSSCFGSGSPPAGPTANLVMDAAGNLYGTTCTDGAYGYGAVFKLTSSGGGWTYDSLHDFMNENDGANPIGVLSFDSNGIIYGTASSGGSGGAGTVWEITP